MMTVRHISILLYVLQTLDGAGATMSALQGEHDDDRTAHIHFALCASSSIGPARDHIKPISYVPYGHHPPCPPQHFWGSQAAR